jgi:hypothetical protein
MPRDKKKFFGKHKEGGKQKGTVKELGSNVYVSDVNRATDKFVILHATTILHLHVLSLVGAIAAAKICRRNMPFSTFEKQQECYHGNVSMISVELASFLLHISYIDKKA